MALPGYVDDAIWINFDETSGTTVTDIVNDDDYTVAGTSTNLWDDPGRMNLSGDNSIKIQGRDSLFDLSTFPASGGTIILNTKVFVSGTDNDEALMCFSNIGSNTNPGFISKIVSKNGVTITYSDGGSETFTTLPFNITSGIDADGLGLVGALMDITQVISTFDSRVWFDGIYNDFPSRSCENFDWEDNGGPHVSDGRGFVIFGQSDAGTNVSKELNSVTLGTCYAQRFTALRIESDQRSKIPGLILGIVNGTITP